MGSFCTGLMQHESPFLSKGCFWCESLDLCTARRAMTCALLVIPRVDGLCAKDGEREVEMRCVPLVATILLLASPVLARDAYLCISESSAGIAFDKDTRKWHGALFTSPEKYILRKTKPDENISLFGGATGPWGFFEFGQKSPIAICQKDFTSGETQACADELSMFELEINLKTLRFQLYYSGAYVAPNPSHEGGDTPAITVGTCSPL
jgi:hypothetical protein